MRLGCDAVWTAEDGIRRSLLEFLDKKICANVHMSSVCILMVVLTILNVKMLQMFFFLLSFSIFLTSPKNLVDILPPPSRYVH